jgi:YjbE family integral membrane protein
MEFSVSAVFGAVYTGFLSDMNMPGFWVGVLQIIWIDILLAGDNAVVIALACRNLPKRVRVWGMILGAGAAILLRILFTLVVTTLMGLPFLKIVGGLALFYIAIKLLMPEEEDVKSATIHASERLWKAVRVIAAADVVMSLDNVIAISGASHGNVALFVFGLMASIPLIIAGARMVMELLSRFPMLIWAGGALLGWIAGLVMATDPVVKEFLTERFGPDSLKLEEAVAVVLGAAVVIAAGWWIRRKEAGNSSA